MDAEQGNASELRTELQKKRSEVSLLRSRLEAAYNQKEERFHQLLSVRNEIRSTISSISSLKNERDQLSVKVKDLKGQRDQFHAVVKEKAVVKKNIDEQKKGLLEKMDVKTNPAEIKSAIAKMEHRLETEVMPFENEEKIRKRIKELQLEQKRLGLVGDLWKNINAVAADFSEARRKAEEFHHQVQETADLSQKKHELLNPSYEKLKQLREQEKLLAAQHLQLKEQYQQDREELEKNLSRVKELSKTFSDSEKKSFKEQLREKQPKCRKRSRKEKAEHGRHPGAFRRERIKFLFSYLQSVVFSQSSIYLSLFLYTIALA